MTWMFSTRVFQRGLLLGLIVFCPVMSMASSSLSRKPIELYQRRLTACMQYAVEEKWAIKTPIYQAKKHSKLSLHHVVDGYRCWRLQQDFAALRKRYDKDAQSKGALDAMSNLIHATWGETW